MRLLHPIFLILILIIPALTWDYLKNLKKKKASIVFSDIGLVKDIAPGVKARYKHLPFILRMTALFIFIIAFSRPQFGQREEEIITEGVDIILTLDTSSSMKAEDFQPQNRLGAAKEVLKDFIGSRRNDRLGLVVFSKESFTQCPLTLDYNVLLDLLDKIEIGMIEDGTAIGLAIANATNRLRDSEAKSKIIILLTDGVNNAGKIDPLTASKLAKTLGIKIYTIGAGKPGKALYPVTDPIFGKRYVRMDTEIDEELLSKIAEETGGLYFRAKDEEGLKEIYKTIGELEKTKIETKEYANYNEGATSFIFPGFMIFITGVVLSNTLFRKLP
ncbi:MAG: VWA domain-containing protein [Candidatus Omnitrophota bacterium]